MTRIRNVFSCAAQKAAAGLSADFKLDVSTSHDHAVVLAAMKDWKFELRFMITADDSILAETGGGLTFGAGGLYDDRIMDVVTIAIKNVIASEFAREVSGRRPIVRKKTALPARQRKTSAPPRSTAHGGGGGPLPRTTA